MKTHYDLLGLDPSADIETIKKAFRREIARYHPDKVTHLGAEFQEMASTRAAELTAAYKILSDADARAEYDESLKTGQTFGGRPSPAAAATAAYEAPRPEPQPAERERAPSRGFDEERADKDDIVRRATLMRIQTALQLALGDCDLPTVRGFELACVPRAKAVTSMTISQFFKREVVPIVLVRIATKIDGALATDAFANAVRSRLESKGKPVALLLIGTELAPSGELARAIEEARKKSPASQDKIFPVPIDGRDWTAKIPLNAPEAIRTLVGRLKSTG